MTVVVDASVALKWVIEERTDRKGPGRSSWKKRSQRPIC
jgi:hypothetical protein